jgi:hypothetical protein
MTSTKKWGWHRFAIFLVVGPVGILIRRLTGV